MNDEQPQEPSATGLERFPESSGYYNDGCDLHACTCKPDCENPCKGSCGCEACSSAYSDFLSAE